jgi:hypothetical protein
MMGQAIGEVPPPAIGVPISPVPAVVRFVLGDGLTGDGIGRVSS